MRELMIEAEYAPFAPNWFLETASRWFTVQKTPCLQTEERIWRICAENLERYAAGDPLRNLVREIPL